MSAIVQGSSVVGPLIVGVSAGAAWHGAKATSGSASASEWNCATLASTPGCVAALLAPAPRALVLPDAAGEGALAATSARSFAFESWSFFESERSSASIFASSDLYDSRFSSSAFSCFSASFRSLRSFATDSVCVVLIPATTRRKKHKKKRSIRPFFLVFLL